MKKVIKPDLSDKEEIRWARGASLGALLVAAYFGINPPSAFVAKTVAFAFGLAASSFFPTLVMGIFSRRMNKEGAIAGMVAGITFTLGYIIYFQFGGGKGHPEQHLFGISPEGIGFLGMFVNFIVAAIVAMLTPQPPKEIRELIDRVRTPGTNS
jgi:cation/acetate symporter